MSFICLFLLATILSQAYASNNTTISSTWIKNTRCTFYYSNDITFVFLNCTNQSYNNTSWNSCVQRCCEYMPSGDYRTPSLLTIYTCRDSTPEVGPKIVAIIMIVLVCAFALLVLFCFIIVLYRIFRHHHSNRVNQFRREITSVEWEQQLQFQQNITSFKWSVHASESNPIPKTDSPCSICLEEHTTTILYCGHQYHPHCIGAWLNKSNCCPCCRRDNIRGVKVYCQKCRWMYVVCTSTFLADYSKEVPKECHRCLKELRKQELNIGNENNFFIFEMQESNESMPVMEIGYKNRPQTREAAQIQNQSVDLIFENIGSPS